MTPPRWVDDQGRALPTRPCLEVPARDPGQPVAGEGGGRFDCAPIEVLSFVEW